MRYFCLLFLALLAPSYSALGQNPPPQLQPRSNTATATDASDRQIVLDVQVTDKSSAPVRGLQKSDFTLMDDKRPQSITSFQAVDAAAQSDQPVSVILVVDAVNAAPQAVAYERGEIKKFLLRNGGQLAQPVSLVVFTDGGTKIQEGSSRDGNALAALYDQYETGVRSINRSTGYWGATEQYDLSLKTLTQIAETARTQPGRKLVVWVSPGWPLLTGPDTELSHKGAQEIFNSIVSFSTMLRQARLTLYNVDPLGVADAGGLRTTYYEEFLKGVPSPSRAVPADLGLQVLAVQSGGRVVNSSNDIAREIGECAADGNAFYVLSFNASRADGPNEYHALEVKVETPGVKVRTRSGYYVQPQ